MLFKPVPPPGGLPYYLDVGAFQVALDNALKNVVAGYVAQLRQSDQILFTNAWQYAKRPQDGSELWTADVQMHVASVSKLMTAMAMMVLFRDHSISPDAQPSNGDGWAGINTRSAASRADRISPVMRGGPSMTT